METVTLFNSLSFFNFLAFSSFILRPWVDWYSYANNLLSFKYKYVYLFAYETKVDKVRNIQIYESEGYPKCKAEVILISKKVTDVGRIFKQAQEGMKRMENVELDYYIDKGWIMKPLLPEPFTEFLDE